MTNLYYRDGKRITEQEALDADGGLRNHVVMRVPQFMRDGRPEASHRCLLLRRPNR
jgi:hypothetical protein